MMAEQLKTPPTLFLPDIEGIEDPKTKQAFEEINKAIEELVTAVYSDTTRFHERIGADLSNVVEDTTPQLGGNLDTNGFNIAFPATQVPSAGANTLDDYEEGTWTMGISFGGETTGITYSTNTGYYTKIGNIVTISGRLGLSSKGTSVGGVLITGLPFTEVNNDAGVSAVALLFYNITFANQVVGIVVKNTKTIQLWETTEVGWLTTLTNADFANNSVIILNCTYRIEE